MRFERELLKGVAPTLVLEMLSRQAMYGYELSKALNLEAKRLVKGAWQVQSGGPARKYYSLTARGKRELAKARHQLEQMQRGIELVLRPTVSPG